MRRHVATAVAVLLAVAVLPLAARAAGAPAITLNTPSAEEVVVGQTTITWAYRGFSPAAWVDVEASRGDEPYRRIARVRIDDGTPGYTGSTTWATGPDDDSAEWTIRLVVPSNKWVRSQASPVIVDNTAPEATEVHRTPANAAGWNNGDVTVRWACTDAASGPVAPEVTATVVGEGTDLSTSATCSDRAGHSTTATAGGIDIDRTAPGVAIRTDSAIVPDTPPFLIGDAWGSASDELSGVAGVVVTFVDAASSSTERQTTCINCGTASAWWTASTTGLASGPYRVTATATDVAGNVTTSAAVEVFLVAFPAVPTVEVPDVTPPETTVPDVTPPETTVPDVTPPEAPETTAPSATVPPVDLAVA